MRWGRGCCKIETRSRVICLLYFFFFNDTATTEIYTLSLHDALPICFVVVRKALDQKVIDDALDVLWANMEEDRNDPDSWIGKGYHTVGVGSEEAVKRTIYDDPRSEEHTSELQSQAYLVCRLLLEKKKTRNTCLESETVTPTPFPLA